MATKKVIAICQSGGEFVKGKDGTMSYSGGEAFAIDIDQDTQLGAFKKEVAENFECDVDSMTVKYFLPGNKKTLITIAKDKDLARMVNFVGDTNSVDVFFIADTAHPRNVSPVPASRSSRTTVSDAVPPDPVPVPDDVMENSHDPDSAETEEPPVPLNVDHSNSKIFSEGRKRRKVAPEWENAITGVDQRFSSVEEFREAVRRYSIAHGFAFKCKKNDNLRVTAKCKSEGCKWRIYASRLPTTQLIRIRKMVDEHTCDGTAMKFGCRATRYWVGSIIQEKLKSSSCYRPKDIVDDIQREFGIKLNYSQAWRAKEIAKEQLQGSCKEAYGQLPLFCKKIKEVNPGSVATLTTKEDSSFHRLFISFHASIAGFQQGCRPLIFLDCASLNSKYQGVLFAATVADGDDGAFTIALAIMDTETADNWQWFLEELKAALSLSGPVTFVADFQNGMKETLAKVYSNSCHSYCLRYLAEKLNKDLKGQLSHEARRLMLNDFYAAAYSVSTEDFDRCVNNIKAISHEAYEWVINSEPKQWANAFFVGTRYNLLTSNIGQQFFDWAAECGELPLTQMIDVLRCKMMDLIYTRRMKSNQWSTRLTPSKEELLEQESQKAKSLHIAQSHGCMFEVRGDTSHVVDVDNWVCSCKQWQLTCLPCCHAIAVFRLIDRDPYEYCSKFFTLDCYHLTYAGSIEPVPCEELVESDENQVTVTPPAPMKRPPGRPKVKSTEPADIVNRTLQCGKCKKPGHNKRSCKDS